MICSRNVGQLLLPDGTRILKPWLAKWRRSGHSYDSLWQHPPSPGLLHTEICFPEGK